jgi:predicted metalloprotease
MRWQRRGRSEDLEDRRGESSESDRIPVRFPLPGLRGGGMSLGGAVALLAVMWLLGVDPIQLLGGGVGTNVGVDAGSPVGAFSASPEEEDLVQFVSFVLDDLQSTWSQLLPGYRNAHLVLFRDATHSACGTGQSEMGPFYCPGDEKVYIDLSFYGELRSRFGAPGDFAQAYVIAHEIGHHVQALTGVEERVRGAQRAAGRSANGVSVRMELQADCFAGVWGHHAARRDVLEPGDIEEGLRAAAAIGDDQIQKMSGRGVHPESFTHGSSEQRVAWLHRGLESGNPEVCDTFEAKGE